MKLLKIKDDLYVPEDFEKNHDYFADPEGKHRYTGITTAIGVLAKPALIPWAARMAVEAMLDGATPEEAKVAHTKKKEAAGEHGTDTHAIVEQWIGACIESYDGSPVKPLESGPIDKFIDWAVENIDRFLFSERRMSNKEHFIAGTADFAYIGKDGKKYMSDFKTSSGIYGLDYFLQVAAYRLLAESEGDEPYDGMTIVRLGKKGDFEVQTLYEYETYRDAFLNCLALYRANAQLKEFVIKD